MATALAGPPYGVSQVVRRTALAAALADDPIWLGVVGALGLGAVAAVVFAAIGFLVGSAVSTTERIPELALLRALGLSGRQMSSWLSLEQVFLLVVGLVGGALLGLLLAWLVLPYSTLDPTGAAVVPTPVIVVPWAAILPIYFVLAVGSSSGTVSTSPGMPRSAGPRRGATATMPWPTAATPSPATTGRPRIGLLLVGIDIVGAAPTLCIRGSFELMTTASASTRSPARWRALRVQQDVDDRIRYASGRAPTGATRIQVPAEGSSTLPPSIGYEVAVSTDTAGMMGVGIGDILPSSWTRPTRSAAGTPTGPRPRSSGSSTSSTPTIGTGRTTRRSSVRPCGRCRRTRCSPTRSPSWPRRHTRA